MWLIDILIGLAVVMTFGVIGTGLMHFWVGAPYVPTPSHIIDAMIGLVSWRGTETVVDLGAGDARLLEAVKKRYPQVTAIGCEIVPTIWLLGIVRQTLSRSGVRLKLANMLKQDVGSADVVFLYLFPALMRQLEEKFDRELRSGTIVVTHTFGFTGREPEAVIKMPRLGGEISVYRYRW